MSYSPLILTERLRYARFYHPSIMTQESCHWKVQVSWEQSLELTAGAPRPASESLLGAFLLIFTYKQ